MTDNSLLITLLPEFGWSIHGKPVYGPGSVFQGNVELKLNNKPLKVDRIRLVFQGVESLPPFDISPGVVRGGKKNALFGVQQTLWESKDGLPLLNTNQTYSYSFTLQLPMVQYPPSMTNNDYYKCQYKLIAVAETQLPDSSYQSLFLNEEPVYYIPHVETRSLKQLPLSPSSSSSFLLSPSSSSSLLSPSPSLLSLSSSSTTSTLQPLQLLQQQQNNQSDLMVSSKLQSLDYVVGDAILGSLQIVSSINGTNHPSSSLMKKSLDVQLKVYQIIKNLEHDDVPVNNRVVVSKEFKLYPVNTTAATNQNKKKITNLTYSNNIELDLPIDLTPTFTYSSLASITYKLCITVKRKGPLSMWAEEMNMEYPLTMGTLGYGVRSNSDIQLYTCVDRTSVHPTFMKSLEYEDALPVYVSDKLPNYSDVSSSLVIPIH
ncbi:unnamed protein product [Cunninghamella blakesleeana]